LWAAAEVETGGRHEGRAPFGIGGIWENWKDLATGEWIRTFAAITTDANALVAEIHDRMPLVTSPTRTIWRPFPADVMRMWPISTRVNRPANDDPSITEPLAGGCCLGPDAHARTLWDICNIPEIFRYQR
jgi:putative SOS response-associated peptidase YedK